MGIEAQGKVIYGQTAPKSGGGGGGLAGAENGLTVDTSNKAVLGQDYEESGDPAQFLNDRQLPFKGHALLFQLDDNLKDVISFNADAPIDLQTSVAGLWEIWTPANYGTSYSPGGTANRFYAGYDQYDGVNEPTSPRPNVVGMFWGYNETFQFAPVDPTEAAFSFRTETYFDIGTDPHFEFHLPEIVIPTNEYWRLDSTYVSRATGIGFRELIMEDTSWYPNPTYLGAGTFHADLHYDPNSDETFLQIMSEQTDGVTILKLGNWFDGTANFTFQSGLLNVFASGLIGLTANIVALAGTLRNNIVNSTTVSASSLDSNEADSIFDVQSTVFGSRPAPLMTTTQRLALTPISGVGGLMVYDITINKLYVWTGAVWEQIQSV